jgi:two-component system phosphate regulon sensor histidine kinase PhoR
MKSVIFKDRSEQIMNIKNPAIQILMISSIVLLVILQTLWLRGAYDSAADNFRKETDFLFRTTIFALHDSLIVRSIMPERGDTLDLHKTLRFKEGLPDTGGMQRDSVVRYFNGGTKETRIEVFINSNEPDSVKHLIRPLMSRIQVHPGAKNFVIKLGPDSLSEDSIRNKFTAALQRSGIEADFAILSLKRDKFPKNISGERKFLSEIVPLNPLHQYAVSFSGVERLLFKKITPELLFSVFLTLLTIMSFTLMYRSVRTQQKLMEQKNDFISNVTHELKTPVATVSVALEALQNFNALNDAALSKEYLGIAQRELKRLNEMTDKILKSSIMEEKVTIAPDATNLDEVVTMVLQNMKVIIQGRNARVNFQKEGIDFSVHGKHADLYQMVENLIDNALKYSPENPEITIALTGNEHAVKLSVKDNGIGIPNEYQSRIFEKFFRVPTGDVHNIKGYGLGLSFIENVVKSLGGSIRIESEPGSGTIFILNFPRIKPKKFAFKVGKT